MRLLHTRTVTLHEFAENAIPPYAILSHTWEGDEVSYQDMQIGKATDKKGHSKISFACAQAVQNELEYVWVDTCCIDKSSSAELSEAINSMFQWYKNAEVCYVYLADVPALDPIHQKDSAFRKSRWFTRGWTLQELIAPTGVRFYSQDWKLLGKKNSIPTLISEITGIDGIILKKGDLRLASVARRMSWASKRVTTRKEDMAYCLLGIFGVNMPMLYGEGAKAFFRLQEEIIKESDDQSIFAWGVDEANAWGENGILAPSPSYFATAGDIIPCKIWKMTTPHSMTSKGLRIELPVHHKTTSTPEIFHGILSCHRDKDLFNLLEIPIRKVLSSGDEYIRFSSSKPRPVEERYTKTLQPKSVYIRRSEPFLGHSRQDQFLFTGLEIFEPRTRFSSHQQVSHRLQEIHPPSLWDNSRKILSPYRLGLRIVQTEALLHFSSETEPDFVIIVEYFPCESTNFEESQARCCVKFKPAHMSLQKILSEITHGIREDDEYVPLDKKEVVKSSFGFTVTLKKEEVMGVEMFVVDVGSSFPVPAENPDSHASPSSVCSSGSSSVVDCDGGGKSI